MLMQDTFPWHDIPSLSLEIILQQMQHPLARLFVTPKYFTGSSTPFSLRGQRTHLRYHINHDCVGLFPNNWSVDCKSGRHQGTCDLVAYLAKGLSSVNHQWSILMSSEQISDMSKHRLSILCPRTSFEKSSCQLSGLFSLKVLVKHKDRAEIIQILPTIQLDMLLLGWDSCSFFEKKETSTHVQFSASGYGECIALPKIAPQHCVSLLPHSAIHNKRGGIDVSLLRLLMFKYNHRHLFLCKQRQRRKPQNHASARKHRFAISSSLSGAWHWLKPESSSVWNNKAVKTTLRSFQARKGYSERMRLDIDKNKVLVLVLWWFSHFPQKWVSNPMANCLSKYSQWSKMRGWGCDWNNNACYAQRIAAEDMGSVLSNRSRRRCPKRQ